MWSLRYYLQSHIHQSYLVMWLGVAILVGIVLARLGHFDSLWVIILLSGILLLFSFYTRRVWAIGLVLVAGILIGLTRGGFVLEEYALYDPYIDRQVSVQGTVSEDVVIGQGGVKQMVLKEVVIDGKEMTGDIWFSARTQENIKRSDEVSAKGTLQKGFGAYAAAMSYAALIGHRAHKDTVRDARDNFAESVRKVVAEPMASLGLGFLVGQRSQLPPELDEQLRIAGLTHIVVASGYNVTILLRLAKRFFEKISKYLVALSGGSLLMVFLLVTGFTPSMTRAAIVGGLSLAAWYYGRSFYPFVLIAIVMCVTALWNPMYIWGDAGWYLSFAAFFGVMVVAPLLQRYFFGDTKPRFLRQTAGETVAALAMTIPITVVVFHQYSTYALLANILIVPFIPLAMFAVFVAGTSGGSLPWLGVSGTMTEIIIGTMIGIIQWVASLPGASGEIQLPFWTAILYYIVLIVVLIYMQFKTRYSFRDDNIIE